MVYLFAVLIILLNILIAQLSDTYAEVKGDAQHTLELNWSSALVIIEADSDSTVRDKKGG